MSVWLDTTQRTVPQHASTATLSVTTTDATSGGLYIQGAKYQAADLLNIQNSAGTTLLKVSAKGNVCIGLTSCVSALGVNGNIYATGTILGGQASPDYAENITTSDVSIGAADVVVMDPAQPDHVIKASQPYAAGLLGVISTHPGFLTNASSENEAGATDQRPLALSGRVPVKVSTENGAIEPGDYLTSSDIPGVAMKATSAGAVIGKAMGSFDGSSADTTDCQAPDGSNYRCGKVLLFIDNTYYMSGADADMQGSSLSLTGDANISGNLNVGGLTTLANLTVTGNAAIEGDLTVSGAISTTRLTVNGHIITAGNAPVVAAGQGAGTADVGSGITAPAVAVTGNDTSGTITITTGTNTSAATLVTLNFNKAFGSVPRIVLTPANHASAALGAYYDAGTTTTNGFSILTDQAPQANTTYSFTYFVVQ